MKNEMMYRVAVEVHFIDKPNLKGWYKISSPFKPWEGWMTLDPNEATLFSSRSKAEELIKKNPDYSLTVEEVEA